jgi:hypothetical protein
MCALILLTRATWCRPDTRAIDAIIQAPSYSEFRRLKRLKLAESSRFTFWPRSPTPEPEALLATDDADGSDGVAAGANGRTKQPREPVRNPALTALDQEELSLFMCAPAVKQQRTFAIL